LNAAAESQELVFATPGPGEQVLITNKMLNQINAPVLKAEKELAKATAEYKGMPGRLPLGEVNPGQQVLETEVKQLLHAIRMAA
jgi:hypothetical protein